MRIIYLIVADAYDDEIVEAVLYQAWLEAQEHVCDSHCISAEKCRLITDAASQIWATYNKEKRDRRT